MTDRDVRVTEGKGEMKLHLGCGQDHWEGYVNIDSDPNAKADVIADLCDIGKMYEPGTIDEIVMIHSLSYLRLWQARDLFRDVYKLLKKGGKFVAEFPDIRKCADLLLNHDGYDEAVRGIYAIDAGFTDQRVMYVPYAYGWTARELGAELNRSGFAAWAKNTQTHDLTGRRDSRVEAIK